MATNPAPFLKWAGGKAQLLNVLIKYIPKKFGIYCEPFLGGGALFLKLYSEGMIRKAILSDASKDLINCYIAIRDNEEALLTELEILQQHSNHKDFFYEVARPKFNKIHLTTGLEGDPPKAALLVYLNKTCYNGLYRVNSKGDFNVPWGRNNNPRIYDEDNIRSVGKALRSRNVEVMCCDYSLVLTKIGEKDFVYFDPPYQPLSMTSSFTSYTPDPFSEDDQMRLASMFRKLDKEGCFVLMSNSVNPMIEELYKDYIERGNYLKIMAARQISCKGDGRGKIYEYVFFNRPRTEVATR
jgi:DNA adenine methylase